ncbi:MAG: lysophospholipid acyltransferase family protein [Campylobacterota bacterium]|nr:lysophospholipid acyltransferase family protein [Campylobacterota bacterium]
MEKEKRGYALGYKIVLFIYKLVGYKTVSFILNFVALYYAIFSPSSKKSLQSYYRHINKELTFITYFKHIKIFSVSILDRFISRMDPKEITLTRTNREIFYSLKKEGGVVLLSHVGGWATASHVMQADIPLMHVVMRENSKESMKKVEHSSDRKNEDGVNIIDLNQGAIAANVQIANALLANEVVAMMVDRVVDERKTVEVTFLGSIVKINKTPFDIASRLNKPLIVAFIINSAQKQYNLSFYEIDKESKTLEQMAQEYAFRLEEVVKKDPSQWYNFYDYFVQ